MTDNTEFICEPQYAAVFEHFQQICENAETDQNLNHVLVEFQLLLKYFRTVFQQSERKTNKILELKAELSIDQSKFYENINKLEREKEMLEKGLEEMQQQLDSRMKEQKTLVQTIKMLNEIVDDLKTQDEWNKNIELDKGKKTEMQSKSIQASFKPNKISKSHQKTDVTTPLQTFSKFKMAESKEHKVAQKKYKSEIQRLKRKISILSVESKLARDRFDNLKDSFDKKMNRKNGIIKNLTSEKRAGAHRVEDLKKKKASLETNVEKYLNELNKIREDKNRMEEDMKVSLQDADKLRRQIEDKDIDIEHLKESMNNLSKSKTMAFQRVDMFEENLAIDREKLATAQKEIELLNKTLKKLESDLGDKEIKLKLNEEQKKRLESNQTDEMEEQQQMIEYYKKQVQLRDKRLSTLEHDLSDSRRDMTALRLNLKNKSNENSRLTTELSAAKKASGKGEDMVDALASRLDAAEDAKSTLEKELREAKQKSHLMLKERNRFRTLVTQLQSVSEYQNTHIRLLDKQQNFLKNSLKVKDSQVEKAAKKQRSTWAKF